MFKNSKVCFARNPCCEKIESFSKLLIIECVVVVSSVLDVSY